MTFRLTLLRNARHWGPLARWLPLQLLLLACQSNPPAVEEPVARVGFEDVEGRIVPTPLWLTDGPVHNGQRAFALLNTESYGINEARTWGSLGQPRTLEVGGYVQLPHGRTHVALIVQVDRNEGTDVRYYKLLPIHEVVKRYNSWQLVHATHELPPDLRDDDMVKVFVWQWDVQHTLFFDDIYLKKLR